MKVFAVWSEPVFRGCDRRSGCHETQETRVVAEAKQDGQGFSCRTKAGEV